MSSRSATEPCLRHGKSINGSWLQSQAIYMCQPRGFSWWKRPVAVLIGFKMYRMSCLFSLLVSFSVLTHIKIWRFHDLIMISENIYLCSTAPFFLSHFEHFNLAIITYNVRYKLVHFLRLRRQSIFGKWYSVFVIWAPTHINKITEFNLLLRRMLQTRRFTTRPAV